MHYQREKKDPVLETENREYVTKKGHDSSRIMATITGYQLKNCYYSFIYKYIGS